MVDLMNKAVCLLAKTVVLRNKKYIDEMLKRYKISTEHVKYLELWRRYPMYTEPQYTGRVLFFGRINPYKGANNLLEIVRLCPEIQFDVIGKVDPLMEDIAKQLSREKNVKLVNEYVSDDEMREAFTQADWIILPYNSASQSGIIIDAYKYSRPVIAFDVGAIAEQVEDGLTGYLIPPNDIEAMTACLKKVELLSINEYRALSVKSYNYGKNKYGLQSGIIRFCKMISE